MSVVFDAATLDRLLPFRITCDTELVVVGLGRSAVRVDPGAIGLPFFEAVRDVRPAWATRRTVLDGPSDGPFLARMRPGLLLRGQWLRVTENGGERLLFAATPYLSSPDELARHGLTVKDLAAHDPVLEQVFQLQAQRTHLRDLEELSRRLAAAREAAEAADRAKTQFLANVSHELRTPMHIVLGFSELLAEEGVPPEVRREHVAAIRSNGEALARLVDDLLDMARVEEGHLALVKRPVDLDQLLHDVLLGLTPAARARRLTLSLEPSGNPRPLVTDPIRLRQIVQNLIDNALKFTSEGGVRVQARLLPGTDARAVIAVEDTGSGVGDDAHLLFEPFMRLSRGREVAGHGLGLALSRRLARAMGGDLRYEPLPRGSRFVLEVRARWADAEPAPGRRVLIVGENPPLLRLVRSLLERAGCRVEEAGDGASACALVANARLVDPISAVVVEPRLSDGDVVDLLARMRQLLAGVVVLPTTEDRRVALLAAGAVGVLSAPLRARELVALVGLGGAQP